MRRRREERRRWRSSRNRSRRQREQAPGCRNNSLRAPYTRPAPRESPRLARQRHSTTESGSSSLLMAVLGAPVSYQDSLHLVFHKELHFLELDFFEEVFRTDVGRFG